ncbi:hypothetical protein EGR_00927 [Echinococcus granulosus]|uniref:Uncharacterized protein n=1 Tax=Echinococcus granulosus TaxID=6210 RepID=W6USU9_ECHGR|nr:hypothetical protein EGR_00927 [Echinococcus granulosus]EUB64383.1 hypothetical protein EGR_00927 [Echinococcus granulosus]
MAVKATAMKVYLPGLLNLTMAKLPNSSTMCEIKGCIREVDVVLRMQNIVTIPSFINLIDKKVNQFIPYYSTNRISGMLHF